MDVLVDARWCVGEEDVVSVHKVFQQHVHKTFDCTVIGKPQKDD